VRARGKIAACRWQASGEDEDNRRSQEREQKGGGEFSKDIHCKHQKLWSRRNQDVPQGKHISPTHRQPLPTTEWMQANLE